MLSTRKSQEIITLDWWLPITFQPARYWSLLRVTNGRCFQSKIGWCHRLKTDFLDENQHCESCLQYLLRQMSQIWKYIFYKTTIIYVNVSILIPIMKFYGLIQLNYIFLWTKGHQKQSYSQIIIPFSNG